ncbi:unnamed protein product, partial [Rotaria sp. Silwood1]
MSQAEIEREIKNNDNEDPDSTIARAAAVVWQWAQKQPAKVITNQAVKAVLIDAGPA